MSHVNQQRLLALIQEKAADAQRSKEQGFQSSVVCGFTPGCECKNAWMLSLLKGNPDCSGDEQRQALNFLPGFAHERQHRLECLGEGNASVDGQHSRARGHALTVRLSEQLALCNHHPSPLEYEKQPKNLAFSRSS